MSNLGIYIRKMKAYVDKKTYINVHSDFLIALNWEQPKYPSMGKWIKRLLYILSMECYLSIKGTSLLHVPIWMLLKITS